MQNAVDMESLELQYWPRFTRGDEVRSGELLQKLIGNSLKHRNRKPPVIHRGVARDGANWRLAVRGNWIGMDRKDSECERVIFQRLHSREKDSGSTCDFTLAAADN